MVSYLPFLSNSNVTAIGFLAMVVSSVMLLWLARNSRGIGQITLLVAAFGGPWLLLLERGNLDAVIMWVAVLTIALTRRYPTLAAWSVAAILIWIVGTWKYYPFAFGSHAATCTRTQTWLDSHEWVCGCNCRFHDSDVE